VALPPASRENALILEDTGQAMKTRIMYVERKEEGGLP